MHKDAVSTEEAAVDALQVMEEANRIIEDFPLHQYVLYAMLFLLEIAIAFWIALSL
jgi:hypothetical protein